MSSLTKAIEEYITRLFEEAGSHQISLRRKELAERFGCVPSQINYVLRSRFAPEHGFVVESQRGGHGYIRIVQLRLKDPKERVDHIEKLVGRAITEQESKRLLSNLQNRGLITPRERLIIEVALRNQDEQCRNLFDVPVFRRDTMRAELLKRLITSLALM
ncbi:MAG: CtsR family transcriptional regulator [Thermanaerothrix sp.]|nr:CtsR family transcriptional regulator [Thermanaerothrix sp.]